MTLDFMPSPSPEHPGLFIRDPYRFSDAMLIVPPLLVECLHLFDGKQTDLDLRAALVRLTQDLEAGGIAGQMVQTLSQAGFLHDENFQHMEHERRQAFAALPVREPAHAGLAYPADPAALGDTMLRYMDGVSGHPQAPLEERPRLFAL